MTAHRESAVSGFKPKLMNRSQREEAEATYLADGATRCQGSGNRPLEETPDPVRTAFERDRDRILHSNAFRRLAGKTQVFIFPKDHQRTRLTHALEVAQVATAVARGVGLNAALTEAIALGHDCGHGPGGHASEDAFSIFLDQGYDHAQWGADRTLRKLNLCVETVDGIRNHSWSRPSPSTPEGSVVSFADRIAYCAHDLEDAIEAGIVSRGQLPEEVSSIAGIRRSEQLKYFISDMIQTACERGEIGMSPGAGKVLSILRRFNYENVYTRNESLKQSAIVVDVLRSLVEYFCSNPMTIAHCESALNENEGDLIVTAVDYVSGMTDRFAFQKAQQLLGYDKTKLPRGIDFAPLPSPE